jgi:3-oxoacyl-[acyl-carrier protein] reductase
MELGINNKVAFIAASSKGLGKSVALELAKEGVKVIINGRNEADLEKTKKEIEELTNDKVLALPGDLSIPGIREKIIQASLQEYNNIDILVTNTGGPPAGKFEEFKQEDWDKAYNSLLSGAVGLIRGFLPGMKEKQWGRIICITSITVKQPVNNLILSNSVRMSVVGLMKTLSNDLGAYNITVNNLIPGYTETNRLKELTGKNPKALEVKNEIPLGRFGKPEEFAAAAAFLASERASYITGISLPVDGGWIKGMF